MADFIGKAVGKGDGIAHTVGQQAGKVVEGAVKKVMGGSKQQEGEKKKQGGGGGFGVGDMLSLAGGNKKNNDGGFDVGGALNLDEGK